MIGPSGMIGGLKVRALGSEREFDELTRIYEAVLPASERKSIEALRRMLARDDYAFSVAEFEGEVAGFAIRARLAATNADLLEYMGVAQPAQGRGVGRVLFAAVAAASADDGRLLLLEVETEAEDVPPAERRQRERRKAFYRSLGCREISGLTYILPNLRGHAPPRMSLMLHGQDLPATVAKDDVGAWLGAIYSQVYGRAADDPAIAEMLAGLPQDASLV